jgi:hypothetical protein
MPAPGKSTGYTRACLNLYLWPRGKIFFGATREDRIDLKGGDVATSARQLSEYGRIIARPCPDMKDVLSLLDPQRSQAPQPARYSGVR